jgi:hypothetical protein
VIGRKTKVVINSQKNINQQAPFEKHIAEMCAPMFDLCSFALMQKRKKKFPCKDYLSNFHLATSNIEELVDGYGAQKNDKWFPFRESVAAGKLFSSVYYNLIHVKDSFRSYRLLEVKEDFSSDIDSILAEMKKSVGSICLSIIEQSKRCDIWNPDIKSKFEPCSDEKLPFKLPADRKVRHVHKPGKTVVYLATLFLNLSEDRDVQEILKQRDSCDFESCIPDKINEENLRVVKARFHNLQSHYDTFIFESDIEIQNRNLPILRGHISIIYHLLQIATELIHYYIRHMSGLRRHTPVEIKYPLSVPKINAILFDFFLNYVRLYMNETIHLCRSMIKSYSEQCEIVVPIPNYRGFHVRPSTLIAKIVAHYGSSVTMILNDQNYDAGIPLDLFRANEDLNALKRRHIAGTIEAMPDLNVKPPEDMEELNRELQILFLKMMNNNHIILYDNQLRFDELKKDPDESMADIASRYIKHFMSICKIDVHSDLSVTFNGDNRALIDIKTLAENGYGEDVHGNNIVLPKELAYLRA